METKDINFEEMRQQIGILKQKLDRQEIVSDHLLRETMRTKVSDIDTTKRFEFVCCIICFTLFPLEAYLGFISYPLAIVTLLIVLTCLISTIYMHRPVDRINLMTEDLATVARVMARFKQQYDFFLHYVTPSLLIPWLTWICYEYAWKMTPEGVNPLWLVLPLLIGAAIGALIGYYFHRKAVNAARSIIVQIEEQ